MWLLCAMALAGELPIDRTHGEALRAASPSLGLAIGMNSRTGDRELAIHWAFQIPHHPLSMRSSFTLDRAATADSVLLVPLGEGWVVGAVGVVMQSRGPEFRHHAGLVLGLGLQGSKRKRVQPHAELMTNPMWSLRTGRPSHELRMRMGVAWFPFEDEPRRSDPGLGQGSSRRVRAERVEQP